MRSSLQKNPVPCNTRLQELLSWKNASVDLFCSHGTSKLQLLHTFPMPLSSYLLYIFSLVDNSFHINKNRIRLKGRRINTYNCTNNLSLSNDSCTVSLWSLKLNNQKMFIHILGSLEYKKASLVTFFYKKYELITWSIYRLYNNKLSFIWEKHSLQRSGSFS